MKDDDAKIMVDITIWKMFMMGNICGGNQKDFIHTRESVERLLFLLKIKYAVVLHPQCDQNCLVRPLR